MNNEDSSSRQDLVLDLNFVPTWARQSPQANPYAHYEGGGGREGRDRQDRPRGSDRRGPRRESDRRGDRPARGERSDRRFPLREGDRPAPAERTPGVEGERREWRHDERERTPRGERLPVDVFFIPERQRLALLVRDIQSSGRAYPLMELASRFLSNPNFHLVKLEARRESDAAAPLRFHQCQECKRVYLDHTALLEHAVAAHLGKYFKREEIQTEPPAGNFVCVARCRLSGELLGPPNYHSYNERMQQIRRTRFPNMSLDDYRQHIETVRDPELIEKWKQECRTQIVYREQGVENAPALKQAEAEKLFIEKYAAAMLTEGFRAILPAGVTLELENGPLKQTIRDAWQRESHYPFTLAMALRPAFRHMRLHLFKVNKGQTFVTAIKPHPLEARQVVEPIRVALDFLREHPGCTRLELLNGMKPGISPESSEAAELLSPLRWLVEKGHVIEFFDGRLSVPAGRGRNPPVTAAVAPAGDAPAANPAG